MAENSFEQRVRQLLAIDVNAQQIFADLAQNVEDADLKEQFLALAKDEAKHVAISRRVLEILKVA